jgi:hypothetical protein
MRASAFRRHIGTVLLLLALSLPFPRPITVHAADKPSAADQYRALVKEHTTAVQEYNNALREAKTPEERKKVTDEKRPQPQKLAGRFLELAEKNPKDPVAVDALIWVATFGYQSPEAGQALDALAQNHAGSDKLAGVCQRAASLRSPAAGRLLKAVLDKNPKRELQGQACLGLAQLFRSSAPLEAEKYLNLVIEKFADLKYSRGTMGEFAQKELDQDRIFGIGKVAPDIAGEDIQGKAFKLSDYRGKVVAIDFWGDW